MVELNAQQNQNAILFPAPILIHKLPKPKRSLEESQGSDFVRASNDSDIDSEDTPDVITVTVSSSKRHRTVDANTQVMILDEDDNFIGSACDTNCIDQNTRAVLYLPRLEYILLRLHA